MRLGLVFKATISSEVTWRSRTGVIDESTMSGQELIAAKKSLMTDSVGRVGSPTGGSWEGMGKPGGGATGVRGPGAPDNTVE